MSDNIIQLNEDLIKHDLKDLVRSSVEETLNALLDKEADELVNAQKYERSTDRQGYRSGHYKRNFQTTAGEVELKVPKLKGVPFETAIIERLNREIKRRTKAIGAFPDGQSALMLVCARLRSIERNFTFYFNVQSISKKNIKLYVIF
jgi:transposase-like protein